LKVVDTQTDFGRLPVEIKMPEIVFELSEFLLMVLVVMQRVPDIGDRFFLALYRVAVFEMIVMFMMFMMFMVFMVIVVIVVIVVLMVIMVIVHNISSASYTNRLPAWHAAGRYWSENILLWGI
jgi:hypothetical protein